MTNQAIGVIITAVLVYILLPNGLKAWAWYLWRTGGTITKTKTVNGAQITEQIGRKTGKPAIKPDVSNKWTNGQWFTAGVFCTLVVASMAMSGQLAEIANQKISQGQPTQQVTQPSTPSTQLYPQSTQLYPQAQGGVAQ